MGISDTPLVTIGIPTYNRPEKLDKALTSIARQTYPALEVIVSDNCTQGEAGVAVEKVIDKHSRLSNILFYKQNTNIGAWKNFQYVFEKSSSPYFLWCADDDSISSKYVEHAINIHQQEDFGVVCGKWNSNSHKNYFFNSVRCSNNFNFLQFDDPIKRIKPYLFLDESTHKAVFIYGVWNSSLLKETINKFKHFSDIYIYNGMDIAMLLYALGKCKFFLMNEFCITKYYDDIVPGSFRFQLKHYKTKVAAFLHNCSVSKVTPESANMYFELLTVALKDFNFSENMLQDYFLKKLKQFGLSHKY